MKRNVFHRAAIDFQRRKWNSERFHLIGPDEFIWCGCTSAKAKKIVWALMGYNQHCLNNQVNVWQDDRVCLSPYDLMNPNLISALAIFSVALKMRLHVVFRPVAAQRVGWSRRRQVEYVANFGDLFQAVHAGNYLRKIFWKQILIQIKNCKCFWWRKVPFFIHALHLVKHCSILAAFFFLLINIISSSQSIIFFSLRFFCGI